MDRDTTLYQIIAMLLFQANHKGTCVLSFEMSFITLASHYRSMFRLLKVG